MWNGPLPKKNPKNPKKQKTKTSKQTNKRTNKKANIQANKQNNIKGKLTMKLLCTKKRTKATTLNKMYNITTKGCSLSYHYMLYIVFIYSPFLGAGGMPIVKDR